MNKASAATLIPLVFIGPSANGISTRALP